MKLSVSDLWPKIRVENANAIAGLLNPNRTTSRVHVDAYLMDFQAVMTILRSRPTIRCLQRSGTVIDSRALQLNDGGNTAKWRVRQRSMADGTDSIIVGT